MNPIIKTYIDNIEDRLHSLESVLADQKEEITHQAAAHERLLQQYWSRGKELGVMQHSAEEITEIQEENERLNAAKEELLERTNRVLGYTKALTEEFRQ